MSKIKIKRVTYLVLFLAIATILSACSLFAPSEIDSAIIYLNDAESFIWWQSVEYADSYDIYLNNTKITNIKSTSGTTVYDYSAVCTEYDTNYVFKIKSVVGRTVSEFSNSISVLKESAIEADNINYHLSQVEVDNDKSTTNISVTTSGLLTWNQVQDASKYIVVVCVGGKTYNFYKIEGTALNLTRVANEETDVLAVKVATMYDGDDNMYVASDGLIYFNPLQKGEYTDSSSIYLFDGEIHDKYITSDEELRNYAYYNFINRIDNYNLLISAKYKSEILQNSASITSYLQNFISSKCYLETYETINRYPTVSSVTSQYMYNYSVQWILKATECKLNNVNADTGIGTGSSQDVGVRQYVNSSPYYERVMVRDTYQARSADYDDFASDKRFLSCEVESSEQLFWAIEGGFTPIVKSGSRAYYIYKYAKDVLREIISEDMTDYEKALSIHDWLCYNFTYDYYSLYSNKVNMTLTCYYLEAIFLDSNQLVVCDGYSKAYSLLCNMEGIECIRVTGTVPGGGHAWNKVKIGDVWYIVDVTNTEVRYGSQTKVINNKVASNIPVYEIPAHEIFLVSDIDNYSAFEYRTRNFENECNNDFYYYDNDENIFPVIINNPQESTDEEYEQKVFQAVFDFLDYIYAYNFGAVDVAIDYNVYAFLFSTYTSGNNQYTFYNKALTQYYQDKIWANTDSLNLIPDTSNMVSNRDKDAAIIMLFTGTKLIYMDNWTEEQQQAYNEFRTQYIESLSA